MTALLTVAFSFAGFAFLVKGLSQFGYSTFIITPICIGFFIGQRPGWKINLIFALLVGIVAFLMLLIAGGAEYFFCIVLVSPVIIAGMIVGTAVGYWLRKQFDENKKSDNLKLTILPLMVFVFAGIFEHYFIGKYDYATVSTGMYLPYRPEKVYDFIKSVDTVNTDKPFLLKLGLPVPEKCILRNDAVGAKRTCYFEGGAIEETITAIKPGRYLKMDVTGCTLPLPEWLKFTEAIYLFEPKGKGTLLTRITRYRTELKPRFYWGFLEAKAIEAEHEYVLNDLKRRLEGK